MHGDKRQPGRREAPPADGLQSPLTDRPGAAGCCSGPLGAHHRSSPARLPQLQRNPRIARHRDRRGEHAALEALVRAVADSAHEEVELLAILPPIGLLGAIEVDELVHDIDGARRVDRLGERHRRGGAHQQVVAQFVEMRESVLPRREELRGEPLHALDQR
ncbi:MAG: hypothetical protein IPG05_15280 [Gemmatimonadetes bacterium]|nr:hypothetical protein [Gemmatimonadota bacterium]